MKFHRLHLVERTLKVIITLNLFKMHAKESGIEFLQTGDFAHSLWNFGIEMTPTHFFIINHVDLKSNRIVCVFFSKLFSCMEFSCKSILFQNLPYCTDDVQILQHFSSLEIFPKLQWLQYHRLAWLHAYATTILDRACLVVLSELVAFWFFTLSFLYKRNQNVTELAPINTNHWWWLNNFGFFSRFRSKISSLWSVFMDQFS